MVLQACGPLYNVHRTFPLTVLLFVWLSENTKQKLSKVPFLFAVDTDTRL